MGDPARWRWPCANVYVSAAELVEEMVSLFKHARSRSLKSALGVIVVAVLAAGCGSSSNGSESTGGKGAGPVPEPKEPVTISFASWVGKERGMKRIYRAFRKEHPNITVEFQEIPSEEARRKLTTQIAGGNPPDTAYLDS